MNYFQRKTDCAPGLFQGIVRAPDVKTTEGVPLRLGQGRFYFDMVPRKNFSGSLLVHLA